MLLDGRAPLPGEVMKFPDLATTFRTIAKDGKDGFYEGRIAQVRFFGLLYMISESPDEAIVDLVKKKGGVMEMEDLSSHESTLVTPIKYTYGGEVTIYEVCVQYVPKEQHCPLRLMGLVSAERPRDHCLTSTWNIGSCSGSGDHPKYFGNGAQLSCISSRAHRSSAVRVSSRFRALHLNAYIIDWPSLVCLAADDHQSLLDLFVCLQIVATL